MNSIVKILALSLFLTWAFQAKALFMLDPYLGYKVGKGEQKSNIKYSYNSPTIGSRAGLSMLGFSIGVDYSLTSLELDTKTLGTSNKEDHKQSSLGLFVGYQLPVMLRGWATYYLNSKLKDDNGPDKGDKYSGSGYAFGIGYTGLPFISLNFEYRLLALDKTTVNGKEAKLVNEIDLKEFLVSVSLPIDF